MNVRELIAELKKMPPDLDVVIPEAGGDEWTPVVQVLYEFGTTQIALLDHIEETVPVEPDPECPTGECFDGCRHVTEEGGQSERAAQTVAKYRAGLTVPFDEIKRRVLAKEGGGDG